MRILFIGPTRVGDTILATSIINHYINKYKSSEFTVVTSSVSQNLFKKMPQLKSLIIVNKMRFSLHWLNIWSKVFIRRWDLVIDLRSSALSYLLLTKERQIFKGNNHDHKDPASSAHADRDFVADDTHHRADEFHQHGDYGRNEEIRLIALRRGKYQKGDDPRPQRKHFPGVDTVADGVSHGGFVLQYRQEFEWMRFLGLRWSFAARHTCDHDDKCRKTTEGGDDKGGLPVQVFRRVPCDKEGKRAARADAARVESHRT